MGGWPNHQAKQSHKTYISSMSHHQGQDTSSTNKINGQEDNTTHQEEQEKFQRVLPGDPIPQPGKYLLKQLAMLCIMLVFDLGIPLALYYGLRDKIGLLYSLIIAGIPPVLWVIYKLVWKRVIDALGVILSLSFILSGVISLVSGKLKLKRLCMHLIPLTNTFQVMQELRFCVIRPLHPLLVVCSLSRLFPSKQNGSSTVP